MPVKGLSAEDVTPEATRVWLPQSPHISVPSVVRGESECTERAWGSVPAWGLVSDWTTLCKSYVPLSFPVRD